MDNILHGEKAMEIAYEEKGPGNSPREKQESEDKGQGNNQPCRGQPRDIKISRNEASFGVFTRSD